MTSNSRGHSLQPSRDRWFGHAHGNRSSFANSYAARKRAEKEEERLLLAQPLGSLLETIKLDSLLESTADVKIRESSFVASYNWLDSNKPTILVPGMPPKWTHMPLPVQFPEDSDSYVRDVNSARHPRFPSEPAVRALSIMRPDLSTQDIDIFGCNSTLGNLLRFARGKAHVFRIDVELIGQTVFFVRKEASPKQLMPGVYGYGHTFPKACTTWDAQVKGSVSHQRMVMYSFGGRRFVVKFQSDGYYPDVLEDEPATKEPEVGASADELDALKAAAASTTIHEKQPSTTSELRILRSGVCIPQKAVFDIKTRSARAKVDLEEFYPQVWLSQTPNFVVAYHDHGRFKEVVKQDIVNGVRDWEDRNADGLRRLAALLEKIFAIVKDGNTKRLEIIRRDADALEIRACCAKGTESSQTLPQSLTDQWSGKSWV